MTGRRMLGVALASLALLIPCAFADGSAAQSDGMGDEFRTIGAVLEPSVGMSFRDVTKRWGPATEKIEYESLRRALWQYPENHVLFEQGRVVGTRPPVAQGAGTGSSGSLVRSNRGSAAPGGSASPGAVSAGEGSGLPESQGVARSRVSPEAERVLTEILREIPSGPDSPSDSFPPPGGNQGGVLAPSIVQPFGNRGMEGIQGDELF